MKEGNDKAVLEHPLHVVLKFVGTSAFPSLIKEVIDHYEYILTIKPDDFDAMVNLAIAYRSSDDFTDQEREYKLSTKAVELAPDYGLAHLNLGDHYAKYGGEFYIVEKDETNRTQPYRVKKTINKDFLRKAIFCYGKAVELDEKLRPLCKRSLAYVILKLGTADSD